MPSLRKEVHYFDRNASQDAGWYRAHFPRQSQLKRHHAIAVEATPYYLFHPYAPQRARAVVPDARLIALLREPGERAFSQWRHNRRRGVEPLEFQDALDAETDRLAGEEDRLADPAYVSAAHQRFSYVARGRYAEQLERWAASYPGDQLMVSTTDELFGSKQDTERRRIREFTGLDPTSPLGPLPTVNVSSERPVPADARRWLDDAFSEPNRRLARLLGDTAPIWASS